MYQNEAGTGEGIRRALADGKLKRSDIFFTSKAPNISYKDVKAQVDASLKESGLEYIDLMLLHSPYGGSENRKGAWKALVEAVEAGKVRSIGVSNYGVHHHDELKQHIAELEKERGGKGKGGIVSVGQWEIHPWCAREDIVAWANANGVVVEAYSPLMHGKRFGEESVLKLAKKYNKSEAQILIRWSLQKGYVPLPKSVTAERIRSNADVYDFELTAEEVKNLQTDEYSPVAWDPNVSPLDN
jgi:diketogulonate reductase-like aldo/keto reductase